jgi:oxygen-dependent protoporphyrinogen oxidase
MTQSCYKVVIVGGGISGLSNAWYLQQYAQAEGLNLEITVIEKESRLGGKIETVLKNGFVMEKGPDSFLARKQPILDLTAELGLVDQLTGTNPAAKKTYVMHKNKLHPLPPGLILGIPTQISPFIKTGLLSPMGKIRAAWDLVLPKAAGAEDESLGHFLRRRLGDETVSRIAEPLLSGIYAGDAHTLSVQATFPQFQQLEQKYGSLIRGMLKSRGSGSLAAPTSALALPAEAKGSLFLTYKGGLQTLVNTLLKKLDSCQLLTGQSVVSVNQRETGYQLLLEGENSPLDADLLLLATPPDVAQRLLGIDTIVNVPYVSVANVVMAFNADQVPFRMDASGFLIPKGEGRSITACTWTSVKWLHTAPTSKRLIRCYLGRAGDEAVLQRSDDALVSLVLKELRDIMNISAAPIFSVVNRWPQSMPQYKVGHLQRLKQLRTLLNKKYPGVYLAGAGYEGVGIPDCIGQGKRAAKEMVDFMKGSAAY